MNARLAGVELDDAGIGRALAAFFSAEYGNTSWDVDFPAELTPSWAEGADVVWEDEHPNIFIKSASVEGVHLVQEVEVDLTGLDFREPVTSVVSFRVLEQRMHVSDEHYLSPAEVETLVAAITAVARLFGSDGAVL